MSDPSANLDPDILRRAQQGEEAAFGLLMRQHYEHTFRLIYSIVHNEADARDICQEVWLTVWKQIGTFRGEARFTTWLHPIATRRALDHLRKRRRWFDRFLPISGSGEDAAVTVPEPMTTDDARQQAEAGERTAKLRAALDSLPPKQRAVLALREVQGFSYEEIAKATGVPVGTVMSRLHHARRLLANKVRAGNVERET